MNSAPVARWPSHSTPPGRCCPKTPWNSYSRSQSPKRHNSRRRAGRSPRAGRARRLQFAVRHASAPSTLEEAIDAARPMQSLAVCEPARRRVQQRGDSPAQAARPWRELAPARQEHRVRTGLAAEGDTRYARSPTDYFISIGTVESHLTNVAQARVASPTTLEAMSWTNAPS